ncbi:hypothetical protein [Desulfovibrio litoralis]|uniref:R.HinP1I restriction endonuclease n=1 Tax=Desulfovibrio litoralis DSM 11393 TaxID=1121455 RepID=A0A1M7T6W5_9BACT|nr:hypothetical protein [Desulfovibrio litoralis]SHN66382.1 R.HinP1I restriction endonuclease [Desulfovibrio litoralis DSM 11393]
MKKERNKDNIKDKRRMFATELAENEQALILDFLEQNKTLIVADILKGRGKFAAEWMLVIFSKDINKWALLPINIVINHYISDEVSITQKGNFKIGKITIQRKGGDSGRETAKMLQFKMNPAELFNLSFN